VNHAGIEDGDFCVLTPDWTAVHRRVWYPLRPTFGLPALGWVVISEWGKR